MRPMIFGTPLLAGFAAMACLVMPQTGTAQGPIVVLEYPGYASASMPGLNQDNPFVYDPDHTASHRVQPDETLSHIITAYYAGSGLDLSVVQMAIVRRTSRPLCVAIPIFFMLKSGCICRPLTR